jgi:hypothetical protein
MRSFCVAILILFGSTIPASANAGQDVPKLSDAAISKALVGKWSEEVSADGAKATGTMHYMNDGTLKLEGTIVVGRRSWEVKASGTWKVSDGVLITTISKTSAPDLLEVGSVSKDPVISIDDKVFRFRDMDRDGVESMQRRVKEE